MTRKSSPQCIIPETTKIYTRTQMLYATHANLKKHGTTFTMSPLQQNPHEGSYSLKQLQHEQRMANTVDAAFCSHTPALHIRGCCGGDPQLPPQGTVQHSTRFVMHTLEHTSQLIKVKKKINWTQHPAECPTAAANQVLEVTGRV